MADGSTAASTIPGGFWPSENEIKKVGASEKKSNTDKRCPTLTRSNGVRNRGDGRYICSQNVIGSLHANGACQGGVR